MIADRLWGFGVARGQILAFSIDWLRRLFKTLALPCECVISGRWRCCRDRRTVNDYTLSTSSCPRETPVRSRAAVVWRHAVWRHGRELPEVTFVDDALRVPV